MRLKSIRAAKGQADPVSAVVADFQTVIIHHNGDITVAGRCNRIGNASDLGIEILGGAIKGENFIRTDRAITISVKGKLITLLLIRERNPGSCARCHGKSRAAICQIGCQIFIM